MCSNVRDSKIIAFSREVDTGNQAVGAII